MTDHPLLILVLIAGTGWLFRLWLHDLRDARKNTPNPRAFPGATPANFRVVALAVGGALLIVAAETLSEIHFGTVSEQSTLTALYAAYTLLCAPVWEEIVFRGYFVVTKRGPAVKWAAAIAVSLAFAITHAYAWDGFHLNLTTQSLITTLSIFATSLWLYAMRFSKLNPAQSLIPCVAAHFARNAFVILIKAAQGHLAGWW